LLMDIGRLNPGDPVKNITFLNDMNGNLCGDEYEGILSYIM